MDMGISGRKALVCGASEGLGFACAEALAREGVSLTIVARRAPPIEDAARILRERYGVPVLAIAADITKPDERGTVLAAIPDPDILVTNAGGPPPGDFRDFTRDDWIAALDANMLTPITLIRSTIDGMIARKFGRIINITSGAVKAPIAELGLSNGARGGLTGFVAGLARQVAHYNVTINNLLPGLFDTSRLEKMTAVRARDLGIDVSEMRKRQNSASPAGRLGRPHEFGAACAFLSSEHAGYIVGQNWLLDGGRYPGTF